MTNLNTMIRVYKTNIHQQAEADKILTNLSKEFPFSNINFDLEDIDNILRVEGLKNENFDQLTKLVVEEGYWIEELKDEVNTSSILEI